MSSGEKYSGTGDKADLDNHADQDNPNNEKYQGHDRHYDGKGDKPDLNNHSRLKNPQDVRYHESREKEEEENKQ